MKLEFKKIKAITKIAKQSKVVNFSVQKNENYFANGILTHNCYMKRNKPTGLSIAKNHGDILTAISDHAWFADVEKPNQTHEEYITYDISCNEDFALHAKYHQWERIFDFFTLHPRAMASFATKYVNEDLLKFNPQGKVRIRFSLMPEEIRKILEPNTSSIHDRLSAVRKFQDAGYDVHLNFSPVVVFSGWLEYYRMLFVEIDAFATLCDWKNTVKAEVIFLTHNIDKHVYNVTHDIPGESLLWRPEIQEKKTSQYGGVNLRYNRYVKHQYIKEFTEAFNAIVPYIPIRYIF